MRDNNNFKIIKSVAFIFFINRLVIVKKNLYRERVRYRKLLLLLLVAIILM